MRRLFSDHYLETPEGLLAQYRKRELSRFRFLIHGIEPRAKHSMPERDKVEIQRQLLQSMIDNRRRSFRGPLALHLTAHTTATTPTQSHHIAKNLLDLFSKPLRALVSKRKSLLYADDQQIHALSVVCHHGESEPNIYGIARPFNGLLQDCALAEKVIDQWADSKRMDDERDFEMALDHFKDIKKNASDYVDLLGHDAYEAWLRDAQRGAQEAVFARHQLEARDLFHLNGLSNLTFCDDLSEMWEQVFAMSPLKIRLSELPHVSGASSAWKDEIEEKLKKFRAEYAWLVEPLLTPLALEVVIRPPAPSRSNSLHDLDNVLRSYLIPRVYEILKPISHHSFSIDFDALARNTQGSDVSKSFSEWVAARRTPPSSTRVGVVRYEAWRLPPADENGKGFVSIALTADLTGNNDAMSRLDRDIEQWARSQ